MESLVDVQSCAPLTVLRCTRTPRWCAANQDWGTILGARVLSELGDDPNRYADARAL